MSKEMLMCNIIGEFATEKAKVLNRITDEHLNVLKNPQNKEMLVHNIV